MISLMIKLPTFPICLREGATTLPVFWMENTSMFSMDGPKGILDLRGSELILIILWMEIWVKCGRKSRWMESEVQVWMLCLITMLNLECLTVKRVKECTYWVVMLGRILIVFSSFHRMERGLNLRILCNLPTQDQILIQSSSQLWLGISSGIVIWMSWEEWILRIRIWRSLTLCRLRMENFRSQNQRWRSDQN